MLKEIQIYVIEIWQDLYHKQAMSSLCSSVCTQSYAYHPQLEYNPPGALTVEPTNCTLDMV